MAGTSPAMTMEFVIACDKREAFAQGSVSDDLSAVAQRAKAEAIHAYASRAMDCFEEPVIGRACARPVGSQ